MPYNAKHINEQDNDCDDTKEIRHVRKSKHNNKRDTQVILLMITNGGCNWH